MEIERRRKFRVGFSQNQLTEYKKQSEIDKFIIGLRQTVDLANLLKMNGSSENLDFGSLIDGTRDFVREFE
mgnify:FL=1|tara:strand:+ start:2634 stop:2846 length:213 start_codon:yes stop_codon:yes gene_type:complete